jgi:hypothetical protein
MSVFFSSAAHCSQARAVAGPVPKQLINEQIIDTMLQAFWTYKLSMH